LFTLVDEELIRVDKTHQFLLDESASRMPNTTVPTVGKRPFRKMEMLDKKARKRRLHTPTSSFGPEKSLPTSDTNAPSVVGIGAETSKEEEVGVRRNHRTEPSGSLSNPPCSGERCKVIPVFL
jgi:hypothetical protein